MQVFSIHDKKSGNYSTPQFYENSVHAMRALGILANDPNTTVHIYSEDFELFHIGEWNTDDGKVKMFDKFIFVTSAKSMVREEKIIPNPKNRK